MSNIEQRLADYRELRDSSKAVLMDDIEHAKTTFSAKGLTNRYLGGIAEGARDVYEVAKIHSVDNRGIIAVILGALALWFGREPLLAAMADQIGTDEPSEGPDEVPAVQPMDTETKPEVPPSGDANDN